MLTNYFKTAFRYLYNNKRYSIINLTGLALGFFCFLLLNFYVVSETSYDKDLGNTYRLLQKENRDGNLREMATIGPRVANASNENFPEIEDATKLMVLGRLTVGNDPENRQYEQVTVVDSTFFKIFNIKFIEGSITSANNQANGIILTESKAKKYFGDQLALGQELYTNIANCVVAGVIEDFPGDTHLEADLLFPEHTAAASFDWWVDFNQNNWNRNASLTYFKLKRSTDIPLLEQKITQLVKENWPPETDFNNKFSLQPVQDIHLYKGSVEGEINKSKGNALYVKIFFWIALVVLLVACCNYTGLLNVAYINRTREIGVRKAVGASKAQLIWQFLIESIILTTIALIIAVIALLISTNLLVAYLGTAFSWADLSLDMVIIIATIGLTVSILSVAYPTFLISKIAPVKALKDQQGTRQGLSLQKTILTFQFVASITLIACTFMFYRQVNYMQTKELGFNSDGIVTVDINSGILRNNFESIKSEFSKLPEVKSVSVMSRVPGEWKNFPIIGVSEKEQLTGTPIDMIFMGADKDFVSTYKLKVSEGNNFYGLPADSTKVLINETALKALGLKNPIGQYIEIPTVNWGGDNNALETPFKAQITGVVQDFYFEDFHKLIRPMVIGYHNNPIHNIDYYSIRVQTDDWAGTLASLKQINDSFDPDNPIEYYILNEKFERFYEADILRSRLLIFFTCIIIFISFMGLLTITAYVLKRRTKEIGIRKVLGATLPNLINLITTDFIKLVLVGSVIAITLSWFIMSKWLQEFAYKLPLHWTIFLLSVTAILVIAFVTVSLQTLKISSSNPVRNLRTE